MDCHRCERAMIKIYYDGSVIGYECDHCMNEMRRE